MVSYAFAELAAAGLVWRRPRLVKVRWTDANGTTWQRADVHAVAYLSKLGAVRLSRRHEQRRGETRRLVVTSAGEKRVLVAFGLVGKLLETAREKMRLLARRVATLQNDFRPTAVQRFRRNQTESKAAPHGGRFSSGALLSALGTPCKAGPDPGAAGKGDGQLERQRALFRRGRLTVENAWPDLWTKPPDTGRTRRHWWLIREFEKLVRELSRLELLERVKQKGET